MKRLMRQRSMLIPAKGMLSALPNSPEKKYSTEERKAIVVAVLEELAWVNYATLPGRFSFVRPPYKGRAYNHLQLISPGQPSDESLAGILRVTRVATKILEATLSMGPDARPPTDGDFKVEPYLFDHGVNFEFHNDFLVARWVRPVVDMEEMSVKSYIDWLVKDWSTRKVGPDVYRSRVESTELNVVLREDYLPV